MARTGIKAYAGFLKGCFIVADKDKDFPYSDEWLEQHIDYSWNRFLDEYKQREEWLASLPPIQRFFYKAKRRLFIWRMDIETWFSWHFDRAFREECIKMREEAEKETGK